MSAPSITFAIPTHRQDRPLDRCLRSIAGQLEPQDEVIVVGDTFDGELPMVEHLVSTYGKQFRYMSYDAGYHDYGHSQLNHALSKARGDYWHANDDDDIYLPDAAEAMRRAIERFPEKVLLFRFISQFGTVYWDQVGRLERDHIGGHCIVAPIGDERKVGVYDSAYNGDFDFIEQTVNHFGGANDAIWITDLICHARPYHP